MKQARRVVGPLWLALTLLVLQASVAQAALPEFTTLVRDNRAAVVNISTTQKASARRSANNPGEMFPNIPDDSPLNDFFKHYFKQAPGAPQGPPPSSLGSGFIISSDGYLLTNAHVVNNADKIMVRLSDHREKPARVIGVDKRSDVALLKIDASDLPTVQVGDSDTLQVGEWVLAIGSPFGLEHTATQGIVSALGRNLPSDTYVPFIQTDVAVNPGNSGGPLFNTDGKVIGINSQIYSNTGGYMGLSFAIPINVAMRVAEQLKTQGHVTRGWLGVMIQPVSQDLASSFGLDRARGALVAQVMPDSPAAKAGLKVGDIILKYAGKNIDASADLPVLVGSTPIGDRVPLSIQRDGKSRTVKVTIETLTEDTAGEPMTNTPTYQLSMGVAELTEAQRKELDIGEHGVLVTEVNEGPAASAGIRPRDILLMLDHKAIDSVADLVNTVKTLPKEKPVSVLIQRNGSQMFLALTLPKQ